MEIEIVPKYDPDRGTTVALIRLRGPGTLYEPAGVYMDGDEAMIEIYTGAGGVEWTLRWADLNTGVALALDELPSD